MKDMLTVLGDREAALARELTKRFEEVLRGPLSELIARCEKDGIKGEITLVIAPADKNAAKDALTQDDIDALLIAALTAARKASKPPLPQLPTKPA